MVIYPASRFRYSSVPPSMVGGGSSGGSFSKSSSFTSSVAQGYRPRYCAAPAKYFTSSPEFNSISVSSRVPYYSVTPTRYFDPTYPTRQFGSRLSKGYTGIYSRPQLYEDYYGESYLPGLGRDSWSAYKISDNSMDDAEDLAYLSKRRDYEVLKGVEQVMAQAAMPAVRVRASSVPPQPVAAIRTPIKHKPIVPQRAATYSRKAVGRRVAPAQSMDSIYYDVPPPKVKVVLETVPSGRDLLTAKERMLSREVVDLKSPTGVLGLKMRLADAHALLDKQGAMLSRFSTAAGDKDTAEVDAEVRRIKHSQAMRAKSVM